MSIIPVSAGETIPKEIPNHLKSPRQIGQDSDWSSVSAGGVYTVGVKNDGSLWAWGADILNDKVQRSDSDTPIKISQKKGWKSVLGRVTGHACYDYVIGLRTDGSLWGWGDNRYEGVIGVEGNKWIKEPTQITKSKAWKSVSLGCGVVYAMKHNGEVWGWGSSEFFLVTPFLWCNTHQS